MATWRIWRFRTDQDLYDTLNGAVGSEVDAEKGLDLDGKTLIINVGGAGDRTVNFAPALSRKWTPEEVVAKISAAHADLTGIPKLVREPGTRAGMNPTYLRLVKDTGAVITVRSTGTANALFGYSITADTVGVPYTFNDVKSVYMNDNKTWYAVTYK